MSKGSHGSHDDSDSSTVGNTDTDTDTAPPGPAAHGRDGGMATRELAPEITEPDGDRPTQG